MCFSYLANQFFFSSSVGSPSATILNPLGFKYSVNLLIVDPLPAASLPSNTIATFFLFLTTHSCSFNNSTCNPNFSVSYCFLVIKDPSPSILSKCSSSSPLDILETLCSIEL